MFSSRSELKNENGPFRSDSALSQLWTKSGQILSSSTNQINLWLHSWWREKFDITIFLCCLFWESWLREPIPFPFPKSSRSFSYFCPYRSLFCQFLPKFLHDLHDLHIRNSTNDFAGKICQQGLAQISKILLEIASTFALAHRWKQRAEGFR